MTSRDRYPDEEIPLLQRAKTPVPWGQINFVFFALLAEPVSWMYIFPFINQLIGELDITGGDDRKIGYYAGLIESLFFITQASTTWYWSRLSDFIGRYPVILMGLLGLSLSSFAFGLSRTLGTLIISRCVAGILNGNVGVMKSAVGDLTDHTNMARVFAIVPTIFCLGYSIGPLYGGALAKPQERWPDVFRGEFWARYPYFLPSLVTGCFTLLTFTICAIFMKESLPSKARKRPRAETDTIEDPQGEQRTNDGRPVPMLSLMKTYSVMIPIANYGTVGLIEIGLLVLLPLFYSSPIEIGGLGLPPPIIGTFLAVFGIVDSCAQALVSARFVEWFGPKKAFCRSVLWLYPLILLFPVMSAVVTAEGQAGTITWILVFVQLTCMIFLHFCFTAVYIFITSSAPDKQSLGSVNGLSQGLTSIAHALGPALTTSLFAFSKQHNILGGNLVYVLEVIFTTILVVLSRHLPEI